MRGQQLIKDFRQNEKAQVGQLPFRPCQPQGRAKRPCDL